MNTKLKSLFDKYNFSIKDRYEMEQFYLLLSDIKKENFLNNFDRFALIMQGIDNDIKIEKDLLIGDAVDRIKNVILKNRKEGKVTKTKKEINFLKTEL